MTKEHVSAIDDDAVLLDDDQADREPSTEHEQAWNKQFDGTSLGS